MIDYSWLAKWLASLFGSSSGNDSDHSASSSGAANADQLTNNVLDKLKPGNSSYIPGFDIGSSGSLGNVPEDDSGIANSVLSQIVEAKKDKVDSTSPSVSDSPIDDFTDSASTVLPEDDPVDDFTNEETGGSGIETGYGFEEFLRRLFASQGAENKANRDFNAAEAVANREFQARESQIQRQWYEQMSNSAYQRAVADMKKAGINPILAYAQGGAATATTGIATGSAASYGVTGGDTLSSMVNSIANLVSAISSAKSGQYKDALAILKFLI